jgi:hypothetical protein
MATTMISSTARISCWRSVSCTGKRRRLTVSSGLSFYPASAATLRSEPSVGVNEEVGVMVAVGVTVGVKEGVGVKVGVSVGVFVTVGVAVAVWVGEGVLLGV